MPHLHCLRNPQTPILHNLQAAENQPVRPQTPMRRPSSISYSWPYPLHPGASHDARDFATSLLRSLLFSYEYNQSRGIPSADLAAVPATALAAGPANGPRTDRERTASGPRGRPSARPDGRHGDHHGGHPQGRPGAQPAAATATAQVLREESGVRWPDTDEMHGIGRAFRPYPAAASGTCPVLREESGVRWPDTDEMHGIGRAFRPYPAAASGTCPPAHPVSPGQRRGYRRGRLTLQNPPVHFVRIWPQGPQILPSPPESAEEPQRTTDTEAIAQKTARRIRSCRAV